MIETITKDAAKKIICKHCIETFGFCQHNWDCPLLTEIEKYEPKEQAMTREDAIYWIKKLAVLSTEKEIPQIEEALSMAVEALQESQG